MEEETTATFVDHVCFAVVKEGASSEHIAELEASVKALEYLDGVLAVRVGVAKPIVGAHRFAIHARTASTAAALAFSRECFLRTEDAMKALLDDLIVVDWEGEPHGSTATQFATSRIGLAKFQPGVSEETKARYGAELRSLPSKFALIKQISVGINLLNRATEAGSGELGGHAVDLSYDIGMVLGLDSSEDADELNSNADYWNVQKTYGIPFFKIFKVQTTL